MSKQCGAGKCSLCGSPGTSKATCPLNTNSKNPDPKKHPLANKSKSTSKSTSKSKVLPKDSKFLQLKGPGSMPKPTVKSKMLTKKIKQNLPKSTFMKSMKILDNRNQERNPVEHSRRNLGLDTMDSLFDLPADIGDKILKYSTTDKNRRTDYYYQLYPDEEYIPIKKIIPKVNYIIKPFANRRAAEIMNETGQYAYFIVPEYSYTLIYQDYVDWYNSYSSALNSMQYFGEYDFDESYNNRFGMKEMWVYFFDSNKSYKIASTIEINGKYEINVNKDLLKNISGNIYKGDQIFSWFDENLEKEVVAIEKPRDVEDVFTIKFY